MCEVWIHDYLARCWDQISRNTWNTVQVPRKESSQNTISLHYFTKFIEQIEAIRPSRPKILAQRIVFLLSEGQGRILWGPKQY